MYFGETWWLDDASITTLFPHFYHLSSLRFHYKSKNSKPSRKTLNLARAYTSSHNLYKTLENSLTPLKSNVHKIAKRTSFQGTQRYDPYHERVGERRITLTISIGLKK